MHAMETRPETSSSSGRFRGQWSFLAHPPQHAQQPRSRPPSSYILHSDRSSISPLPPSFHYQTINGSRSSLSRNLTTASTTGRSVANTLPSQPVLIRVHSADASAHTNPAPRPRRSITMNKVSGLPAISEFSLQGILAAIHEDVEQDINNISEILGRSRLVLADQHDSHLPPQGEIRAAPYALQAVEEASVSDEQLAMDEVFILRDDASLVGGSQAGSAAYGLLERLQAMPRTTRAEVDWHVPPAPTNQPRSPHRRSSVPTTLLSASLGPSSTAHQEPQVRSRNLLRSSTVNQLTSRATPAIVSESHLLVEADGTHSGPQIRAHANFESTLEQFGPTMEMGGAHAESLAGDDSHPFFQDHMQNLLYVSDPTGMSVWLQGQPQGLPQHSQSAERHLRGLLER